MDEESDDAKDGARKEPKSPPVLSNQEQARTLKLQADLQEYSTMHEFRYGVIYSAEEKENAACYS